MAYFLRMMRVEASWSKPVPNMPHSIQTMRRYYGIWAGAGVFQRLATDSAITDRKFLDLQGIARFEIDAPNVYQTKVRAARLKTTLEAETPARRETIKPRKARLGEKHGRARLGADDVRAIRQWAADLVESGAVPPWGKKAAEYQVSEATLRDIVTRRTWSHV